MLDELIENDEDIIHAIRHDLCDGVGIKISKQGGLTASRRQRDICRAAGLVMSIQDTVGSEIAFSAILHMAQSVPRHLLRCALDTRAMVSLKTAVFDAPIIDGGVSARKHLAWVLPLIALYYWLHIVNRVGRVHDDL